MPTDRLLRIVESNDTSTHLVASAKRRRARDHAVDDRLAVLGFAGLEERRVDPGLDEVAFGIDAEQPHRLAGDLPADDERRVEADLVVLEVLAVAPLDVAHRVRHQHRDLEHRGARSTGWRRCRRRCSAGSARRSPPACRRDCPNSGARCTRSPRRSNTVILQNLAMLSMPALVRESDAKMSPLVEHDADAIGHVLRASVWRPRAGETGGLRVMEARGARRRPPRTVGACADP